MPVFYVNIESTMMIVPPLVPSVLCQLPPPPSPRTRVGGGFLLSFLPPPTPPCAVPLPVDALALRAASVPPPAPRACALCQHPSPCAVPRAPASVLMPPACAPSTPPVCALSTPLACALRRHPQPVCCVDAPACVPPPPKMPSPVQEEGLLPGFFPTPPLTLDI